MNLTRFAKEVGKAKVIERIGFKSPFSKAFFLLPSFLFLRFNLFQILLLWDNAIDDVAILQAWVEQKTEAGYPV